MIPLINDNVIVDDNIVLGMHPEANTVVEKNPLCLCRCESIKINDDFFICKQISKCNFFELANEMNNNINQRQMNVENLSVVAEKEFRVQNLNDFQKITSDALLKDSDVFVNAPRRK